MLGFFATDRHKKTVVESFVNALQQQQESRDIHIA